jgi:hypothetical protein
MIDKFVFWFNKNRIMLGMIVGGANILAGISSVLSGNTILAILQFAISIFILLDIRNPK